MAIAAASGLNYKIPQGGTAGAGFIQPQAPVEPMAPAQGEANLPPLNEDLAQVQGLTDKYYDTYGKLKSYVQSMNSQGIDVTQPDYGDPSKMELFKTYKMLEANLMTTANQLKQQQKMMTTLRPLEAQGKYRFAEGVDPNTQLIGSDVNQVGFSTELDPGVAQALEVLKENPMTPQDKKNQEAYFTEVSAELDKRIGLATTPVEKQRLQYEKDQLTKAYQATKLFSPRVPSATQIGQQEAKTAAVDYYKQTVNRIKGVWDNPEYDQIVDDNGQVQTIVLDRGWANQILGKTPPMGRKGKAQSTSYPKKVEYLYKKDGQVYAKYQQPATLLSNGDIKEEEFDKSHVIPDERLDNKRGSDIVKEVTQYNPNLGWKHDDLMAGLSDENLLEEKTRYSKDEEVVAKNRVVEAPDNSVSKAEQDRIVGDLTKTGRTNVTLAGGQQVDIKSHKWGDGYYIEIDGEEQAPQHLKKQDVIKWLTANKYFNKFITSAPAQSAPQGKSAEELRAEELIKKYAQ